MMFWTRKIHRWASLLIGLQVLIWIVSGLAFNVMDKNKASGNTYRQTLIATKPTIAESKLLPVETILQSYPDTIELRRTNILSTPYYLLTQKKGLYRHFANRYHLVNAVTGKLTLIHEQLAVDIAKASYSGPGYVKAITLLMPPIAEFPKQANPNWQINFADDLSTSVYVEQGSGRLVGHSNSDKRFADFFYMLHFMDYGSLGHFNSIQIMLFAFITLWLSLSGLIWTANIISKGEYRFKRKQKHHKFWR
jgi:uncharacterized iron-regulated membrane protein